MSRIREILENRELFYVEEDSTVAEVVQRMAELHIGAILVLHDGELRGLFSERDLMRRVVLEHLDPGKTPVKRVMTTELTTIEDSSTVEEAMQAMLSNKCRHLPVTRNGRVAAFLSMRDLMSYELERKTEELTQIRAYIQSAT